MISKKSRCFLLIAILIFQIIIVKSQTYSVNPITPSNNPNPTDPPISLTNHVIKVGYKDFGFSRNNFTVGKGNVLRWEWEGNLQHSVAESTLETPCKKKEGGFDLGRHTSPYNTSMAIYEERTYVFFSDVADDCKKGMYGGINLPQGYTWPKDLAAPPPQIVTTPLNPTPTPTPTPTGSMSIAAAGAENTQESSSKSSSISASTYYLKESGYGIIIGSLVLISLYLLS
ncbi:hypothetical protein C1645_814350 [Glomus cerebriforme]|uniref:Phytocyanin domain-containing protein n=1 Tax=Glomus cerebriforme TaxID=658196 RepID=A0A397TGN9_9GLOM|nr:hypothetical protein C1645_814350 [Glomus cerebriforme]